MEPALQAPTSPNPLCPDILLIIFEQVENQSTLDKLFSQQTRDDNDTATEDVATLFSRVRLVCRDWNAAAVVIKFREVDLNPLVARGGILSKAPSDPAIPAIQKHMRENMQVATIDGDSVNNWKQFVKLLQECRKLTKIKFNFAETISPEFDNDPENPPLICIPYPLSQALFDWRGKVKLDLGEEVAEVRMRHGLRLFYMPSEEPWTFVAPSINSLKVSYHPRLHDRIPEVVPRLKRIIIASQQLDALALDFPIHFDRSPNSSSTERFAPLKNLKLTNYVFTGASPEDWKIWDFSKLESLELFTVSSQLESFLDLAAAKDFPNLTSLKFSTLKLSYLQHPEKLSEFVSSLGNLTHLSLDTFDAETMIPAISKIGTFLRGLELRDTRPKCCLIVRHLKEIQQACMNIRVLELKIDTKDECVNSILCKLENLEHLKIEIYQSQYLYQPEDYTNKNTRSQTESENRLIVDGAASHKTGVSLKSFQIICYVDIEYQKYHMLEFFDWPSLPVGSKEARRRGSCLSGRCSIWRHEPSIVTIINGQYSERRRVQLLWKRMEFYSV